MPRKSKAINIQIIAKQAGVSAATVSRVINRRAGVGEETRKQVLSLLQENNFMPNYPSLKTPKIAVIYPLVSLTNYFRRAMEGIYSYSIPNQLAIHIVIAYENRKETLLEQLREQQCTGAIALLSEAYYNELEEVAKTDIPVVVVDSTSSNPAIGFIDNDSYSGSCAAANHLIELGHRKIGYLTYEPMSLNQLQRFKGFENTLKSAGIELEPETVGKTTYSKRADQKESYVKNTARGTSGYRNMQLLLKQIPDITAVMATDDDMALGAIAAVHDAGLQIPGDISLVGFDNHPETVYWQPPLTTVDHPIQQEGRMAIEAIHRALKDRFDWTPPREILPTRLIIRKSTGLVHLKGGR